MSVEWRPLIYSNISEGAFVISSDGEIQAIDGVSSVVIHKFNVAKRVDAVLKYKGKIYHETVPRLVAITFIPTPNGIYHRRFVVIFKDGDCFNMKLSNLEWGIPGGKGCKSYEKRKQLLDFVYNHKELDPKSCAALYTQETGDIVTPQTIRNLYAGHLQNIDLFGYTNDDFIPVYNGIKLRPETIHEICKLIVKLNGNARSIHKEAARLFPDISPETIDRIRLKQTYVDISDQYFEYYGRGEFYILKK